MYMALSPICIQGPFLHSSTDYHNYKTEAEKIKLPANRTLLLK